MPWRAWCGGWGRNPSEVRELAPSTAPRTRLVRSALTLATQTGHWSADRAELATSLAEATAGIAVIAARTVDDEARAIAIASRAALAKGQTVGIVSGDQTLSRRIAEELQRFDIEVDDAAGTPLFQSPAGRLARLALNAAVSQFAPVDLMALLQAKAVSLGGERPTIARTSQLIDRGLLRGQRPAVGFKGLRAALASNVEGRTKRPARKLDLTEGAAIADLLDRLENATAPLSSLLKNPQIQAAELATAIGLSVDTLVGDASTPGLTELRAWWQDLAALDDHGPQFPPISLETVLAALMAGTKVTNPIPRRDDIAIWGRLEARLKNPDLMILAGLNEDIWPRAGRSRARGSAAACGSAAGSSRPSGSRVRRRTISRWRVGNARGDHRLCRTASAPSPALPSRLLQRLEAFVGEDAAKALRERGASWLDQAQAHRPRAAMPRPGAAPAAATRRPTCGRGSSRSPRSRR